MTADPLHDALVKATLAVLLGDRAVPVDTFDNNGNPFHGTVNVESAFTMRLRMLAADGQFDDLLHQAMEQVEAAAIARVFETKLADLFLEGLKTDRYASYSSDWLKQHAKEIAVEATKAALAEDDELKDTLRARIGAEVDRNRVGITVQLSDPESS